MLKKKMKKIKNWLDGGTEIVKLDPEFASHWKNMSDEQSAEWVEKWYKSRGQED